MNSHIKLPHVKSTFWTSIIYDEQVRNLENVSVKSIIQAWR